MHASQPWLFWNLTTADKTRQKTRQTKPESLASLQPNSNPHCTVPQTYKGLGRPLRWNRHNLNRPVVFRFFVLFNVLQLHPYGLVARFLSLQQLQPIRFGFLLTFNSPLQWVRHHSYPVSTHTSNPLILTYDFRSRPRSSRTPSNYHRSLQQPTNPSSMCRRLWSPLRCQRRLCSTPSSR